MHGRRIRHALRTDKTNNRENNKATLFLYISDREERQREAKIATVTDHKTP